MNEFIPYFISANLLLILQVLYYRVFLAKQQRFKWNRVFLLGGMAAAITLPLLRLDLLPAAIPSASLIPIMPEIVIGGAPAAIQSTASSWSWLEIAFGVYLVGVAVSLLTLLGRNLYVLNLIRKGQKETREGYTLLKTANNIGPASYFKYIFWNESLDLDAENKAVALAHERCHSQQLHSLDLILIEILKAVFWINPAIFLLRQNLRQTHEFLADQAALKVAGPEGIKRLMLIRHLGTRQFVITNCFHSHIKARLKMLKENAKRKPIFQYLLIAPLFLFMVACSSLGHSPDATATGVNKVLKSEIVAVSETSSNYSRSQERIKEIYSVDDMFIRAGLPPLSDEAKRSGIVCLGEQPETFNLDHNNGSKRQDQNTDSQPKILNMKRIVKLIGYPKAALELEETAKVVTKILVDESGRVIRYEFLQEGPKEFRDAVAAHVEDLLFTPGIKEGKHVKCWVVVPFKFNPNGC